MAADCAWPLVRSSAPEALNRGQTYHVRSENKRSQCVRTDGGAVALDEFSGTDPAELGILEAGAQLRARRLSASELADACLTRIEDHNGGPPTFDGAPDAINAWVRVYGEHARRQARAADERLRADPGAAPLLCGIPIALKDLYGVAGLPLTASSAVLAGNVAAFDATAWARLRDQGMVLLGHTHAHEFAAGGTTDQVGNPWALDRIAGGSSGGSAAALAARMAPAALGTDTCGSLRIPSACCGTSAIKPTHGRLPLDGIIALAPTLDHPGPMARTIADCSALLAGMAEGGPAIDPLSPPSAPLGELPLTPRGGPDPLAGTTIAVTNRPEALTIDPAVASSFDEAVRACERLGARIVRADVPWALNWDDLGTMLFTEAWALPRPPRCPPRPLPAGDRRVHRGVPEVHRRPAHTSAPRAAALRARRCGSAWFAARGDRPGARADAADRPLRPRSGL